MARKDASARRRATSDAVGEEPDSLIRALAALVQSAARNTQWLARYAVDHDEPMYERCACEAKIGLERCDCRVELAAGKAWMRRVAERLARDEFVGLPPKRRCKLCVAGDHDLVGTYEVTVHVTGDAREWTTRMISPTHRTRRHQSDRAARAGGFPPGAFEAQRKAAGIDR